MLIFGNIPEWIQAIATCAGLFGLWFYCQETKKIRVETLQQGIASRRPFLVLRPLNLRDPDSEMVLVNQGPGPAYEVNWSFGHLGYRHGETIYLGAIGIEVPVRLKFHEDKYVRMSDTYRDFYMEYQDSGGQEYWSQIMYGSTRDAHIQTGKK